VSIDIVKLGKDKDSSPTVVWIPSLERRSRHGFVTKPDPKRRTLCPFVRSMLWAEATADLIAADIFVVVSQLVLERIG
jgi:hypothetical protein